MPKKSIYDSYTHSTQVTVKCNKCGEDYCFFPLRVVVLRDCKCSNSNWGSPGYDWPEDKFGDFTLVSKEEVSYYVETPYGRMLLG